MVKKRANRKYKDSLFRLLFQGKEELLELYNAVNQSDYTNADDLEITTLDDVLYMGMKNDASFLFDDAMNLYEAQSTRNENMPLRGVFYLAQLYGEYIKHHGLDIYSATRLTLPCPQFVVFYNGLETEPEKRMLYLSDSFKKKEQMEPALECKALLLNINYGHNQELMNRSRNLKEYAFFIEEVRKGIREGKTLEFAIDSAVSISLEQGILEDFLRKHKSEVKSMILEEYDEELHIRSEKALSYQEGQISATIENYQEFGQTPEATRQALVKKYGLSEEAVLEYMDRYWKK